MLGPFVQLLNGATDFCIHYYYWSLQPYRSRSMAWACFWKLMNAVLKVQGMLHVMLAVRIVLNGSCILILILILLNCCSFTEWTSALPASRCLAWCSILKRLWSKNNESWHSWCTGWWNCVCATKSLLSTPCYHFAVYIRRQVRPS